METKLSRRLWLQRTAMAAAVLPISRWYDPYGQPSKYYSQEQLFAQGAIRLNSNENAYGPSEAAKAAAIESFKEANRYPRHFIAELKRRLQNGKTYRRTISYFLPDPPRSWGLPDCILDCMAASCLHVIRLLISC